MSLGKIVEQINQAKVVADRDIETNVNPDTIRGLRGQKARAVETVKDLTRQYRLELLGSSVFILVAGASKDEFASLAKQDTRVFSSDAEDIYKDLVNRIPEGLYKKEGLSNLFQIVTRHLEDKAREIGISEYPQLLYKQKYQRAITSKEDFVNVIREAINEQVGGHITGINAIASITSEAIARGNSGPVTPVILNTDSDALSLELSTALRQLTPNVFTVVAGRADKTFASLKNVYAIKKVTEEAVTQALNEIVGKAK